MATCITGFRSGSKTYKRQIKCGR